MPKRFSPDMLPHDVDADDTLYVVDRELHVVYANVGWDRFAAENRGEMLLDPGWHEDLLGSFSGAQRARWANIYELLLDGRLPYHQEQMNCSSPAERRIYQLRITPKQDETGDVAWLVHHNVRIDDKSEASDRVRRQLAQLEDPAALADAFQQRIVNRRVRIPSFDVAVHFEPLDEIGGDLVWHREYPSGVSDLIHADVMGHGTAAGRLAAKMAVVLDELASEELSPSETVALLNRSLTNILAEDEVRFATGLCFRFEQDRRHVRCCSFGHEGPIFSRSGLVLVKPGYPVGLAMTEKPWTEVRLDLGELGNRFLVFSDGITEQFNAEGVMFETAGLEVAFQRHVDAPLEELVRSVVDELARFRGAAIVKDDQTLLALEFRGGPTAESGQA